MKSVLAESSKINLVQIPFEGKKTFTEIVHKWDVYNLNYILNKA